MGQEKQVFPLFRKWQILKKEVNDLANVIHSSSLSELEPGLNIYHL